MKFIVYFEIYGKRMKTTVDANNDIDAKAMIKQKIIFHRVEKQQEQQSEKSLKDLFGKDFEDILNSLK